jgi:hypothetical protein
MGATFFPEYIFCRDTAMLCPLCLCGREISQQERERADREQERAEKLAARLKELGIDPDE